MHTWPGLWSHPACGFETSPTWGESLGVAKALSDRGAKGPKGPNRAGGWREGHRGPKRLAQPCRHTPVSWKPVGPQLGLRFRGRWGAVPVPCVAGQPELELWEQTDVPIQAARASRMCGFALGCWRSQASRRQQGLHPAPVRTFTQQNSHLGPTAHRHPWGLLCHVVPA